MNSTNSFVKPGYPAPRPPLQSRRLLDQMRERLRYMHYSLRTEQTYLYWVRWFIRFHGLRHPREMGRPEVAADGSGSPMEAASTRASPALREPEALYI